MVAGYQSCMNEGFRNRKSDRGQPRSWYCDMGSKVLTNRVIVPLGYVL